MSSTEAFAVGALGLLGSMYVDAKLGLSDESRTIRSAVASLLK